MRAIHILIFFIIIIVNGCTTIEVAKEVTKATNSVKKTIQNITSDKNDITSDKNAAEEIIKEKEAVTIDKKKELDAAIKQQKITTIKFIGKTLDQLKEEFGEPQLIRIDGNTKTLRFDTLSCRLFIFFDLKQINSSVKYYEIRNKLGQILEKKEKIEDCFDEIKNT